MKRQNYPTFWLAAILIGSTALAGLAFPVNKVFSAGPPSILGYQGRLADDNGNLLGGSSGTTYFFKFSLWDAATGGSQIWPSVAPNSFATVVREGVFNVNIGDVANGYPDALDYDFSATSIFLMVEVSEDNAVFETLTPRHQVSSVAFAQVAGSVVSASSTITNLTSQNATTTNATSTNFYSTNASTTNLFANILTVGSGIFTSIRNTNLSGFGTRCLQTDNNGLISIAASTCGSGGGGSGGTWSTTTSQVTGQFVNYSNNTTDIIAIGDSSTTTAEFFFDPNTAFAKIGGQFLVTGSTTLQNLTATNATTTHATTTSLSASTICLTNDCRTSWPAAMSFAWPFTKLSTNEQATSTTMAFLNGFISTASSTLLSFTATSATTTNSTSTNLFVSGLASTTDLRANTAIIGFQTVRNLVALASTTLQNFTASDATTTNATTTNFYSSGLASTTNFRANVATIGNLTVTSCTGCFTPSFAFPFTTLGTGENATSTTLAFLNGFISTASSTLSNFTAVNSTTTSATTTNFYASGRASTTEIRSNTGFIGYLTSMFNTVTNFLATGSSTLQNFTGTNATTSQATTTNLAISSVVSSLLKTSSIGNLVAAISGSDYQAPISATFPVLFNSNVISLGFGTTTNNSWSGAQTFLSASTTLQNFTFTNATGSQATTTNLASGTFCLAGDCRTTWPAALSFAWPFTKQGDNYQATSTGILFSGGFISNASTTIGAGAQGTGLTILGGATTTGQLLALGSTTLQNFTGVNGTTTNSTSTNIYTSNLEVGANTAIFGGTVQTNAVKSTITSTAGLTLGSTSTPQILTLDTMNNRVQTGIGAGGASPVLLVVDTKNTGGDPIGVNGAMYYNSNSNEFRCYQDSAWQKCGGQATSTNSTTTTLYVSNIASSTEVRANVGVIGHLTSTLGVFTNLVVNGSSTLQNFTAQNATTSNATTTSLAAATICISGDCRTTWPSASAGSFPFTTLGTGENATSTTLAFLNGFISTASSTLTNFTAVNSTTTNATTTNFYASGRASTTDLRANIATIGNLTVTSCTGCGSGGSGAFPFTTLGTGENATSTTLAFLNGFISTASSTLSNFTAVNSTTTNATTTNFFVSGLSSTTALRTNTAIIGSETVGSTTVTNLLSSNGTSTNLFVSNLASTTALRSNTAIIGNLTVTSCTGCSSGSSFAFPFTTLGTGENATSTTLAFLNGFISTASSTLSTFTATSATTTSATSTNLFVSGLASTTALRTNTAVIGSQTVGSTTVTNLLANNATSTELHVSNLASTTQLRANTATIGNLTVTSCTGCSSSSFAWPFTKLGSNEQATSTTLAFLNGFISTASSTLSDALITRATTTSATSTNLFNSSLIATANLWVTGSSTLNTFVANNSTTTNATSTNIFVSNLASTTALRANSSIFGDVTAGSTTATNLLSSNATSTNLHVSNLASTTALRSNIATIGNLTVTSCTGCSSASSFAFPFTTLGTGENATSTTLAFLNGFISTASSTLSTFTATSATTTNATSTNLFVSGLASTTALRTNTAVIGSQTVGSTTVTNLLANNATSTELHVSNLASTTQLRANTATIGNLTVTSCTGCSSSSFAWPFTKLGSNEQATSTTLAFLNGFISTASSTLSDALITRATTTSATSTNLFNSSLIATANLWVTGSSTLNTFVANNSTTTNATSTNIFVSNLASTTALRANSSIFGDITAGSTTATNLLSSNATSTNLHVSNLASTTALRSNIATIGNLTVTSCTGCSSASSFAFPFTTLGTGENATSTTLAFLNGFISTASSTITDLITTRSTTTGATTTALYVSDKLGIGVTTPSAPLDILADAAGTGFKIRGTNGTFLFQSGGVSGAGLLSQANNSTNGFTIGTDGSSSAAGSHLRLITLGEDRLTINSTGNVGIGTTTPLAGRLNISLSSGPQLALTDASDSANPWTFRTIGNFLYVSTSSPTSLATSSVSALSITSGGVVTIPNVATTTQLNANVANIGNLTVTSCTGCSSSSFAFPFTTLGTGENATSTTLAFLNGFISTASSTLSTFTATSATTTNATSTSLNVSGMATIGTGATVPDTKLNVKGGYVDVDVDYGIAFGGNLGRLYYERFVADTSARGLTWMSPTTGSENLTMILGPDAGHFFSVRSSNLTPLLIIRNTDGYVGIATSSPYAKLSVLADHTKVGNQHTIFTVASSTASGTTTIFSVLNTGIATTTQLNANVANIGNLTVTSCTGCSSGSSFAFPFTTLGTGENATSTTLAFLNGFISTASSTLSTFTATSATTTNATSTNIFVSGLASTTALRTNTAVIGSQTVGSTTVTNLLANNATSTELHVSNLASTTQLRANTATIGNLTVTSCTGCSSSSFAWPFTKLGSNEQATSTTLAFLNGFISTASSTLSDALITRATTTSATSTNLFNSSLIATANLWVTGSSTLNTFVANNSTTTNATSTNIFVSNLASTTALRANSSIFGDITAGSTTATNLLSSNATSTNLHVSNLASTTALRSNTAVIGNLTVTSCTGCGSGSSFAFPFTTLGTGENATSTTLAFLNGFISTASSTLTNFTAVNSTTTNATTTTLFISSLASSTEVRTNSLIGGNVRAAIGTAAAPGFGFVSQPDNGMFMAGTDDLGFASNGAQVLSVIDGEFVGINEVSPEAFLEVSGNGENDTPLFQLSSNDNFDGDFMSVLQSGNVGIGTSTPYAKMSILSSHTLSNNPFTLLTVASSTASGTTTLFSLNNAGLVTMTNATTSDLKANTATIGNLTVTSCTGCSSSSFAWPFTKLGSNEQATSTTLAFLNGFISTASSTLSDALITRATTTSATSTNLFNSSLIATANLWVTGSSTLNTFVANNSTTTNATSTNIFVSNLASTTALRANSSIFGDITAGSTTATNLLSSNATSTNLHVSNLASTTALRSNTAVIGSQTVGSTTVTNLLSNNATSTELHVSNLASTTQLRANIATIGNLTVTSCTGCGGGGGFAWPFTKQAGGEQATSTVMEFIGGFLSNASSTLSQAFIQDLYISDNTIELDGEGTTIDFSSGELEVVGAGQTLRFDSSATIFQIADVARLALNNSGGLNLGNDFMATDPGEGGLLMTGRLGVNTEVNYGQLSVFVEEAETSGIVVDSMSGYGGFLLDLLVASSTKFSVGGDGSVVARGSMTVMGSTTLQNFTASNATTTNATTTNLFASGLASTTNLRANVANIGNLAVTSCTGCGSSSFSWPFTKQGDNYQATSTGMLFTGGFVSNASTTIGAGTAGTGLTVLGGVTTTGQVLGLGSSTFQTIFSPSATATNLYAVSFLANGSSTLQAMTSSSSTIGILLSNKATTTDLHVSNLASTTALRTNTAVIGSETVGSTTVTTLLASNASSTNQYVGANLFVGTLASTTALRANSSIFGDLTVSSTTVTNLLALHGTSTNLHVSNLASTTQLRANTANIGLASSTQVNANTISFGNVTGSNWAAFCTSITGAAALCDGSDDGAAGGGNSKWATSSVGTLYPNAATYVGIGTTTSRWNLQLASSTAPQLTLSDGDSNHWSVRNQDGMLYFATSSASTFATSTYTALTIDGANGHVGIATASPMGLFTISKSHPKAFMVDNGAGTTIFNIDTTTVDSNSGVYIQAGSSQVGNLLQFNSNAGTLLTFITAAGGFQQNIASTTAVRIQNGAASDLLVIDTVNPKLTFQGAVVIGASATTSTASLEVISSNGGVHVSGSTTINSLIAAAKTSGEGRVAVGSTSPMALFAIHASSTGTTVTRPYIFAIGSTTAGRVPVTLYGIDGNGRVYASSTRPTLTTCGGSPTIAGTDGAGRVRVGTATGVCLITFTKTWGSAPFCIVTPTGYSNIVTRNHLALIATTSATTLSVMPSSTSTAMQAFGTYGFHYYCQGNIE